MAGIWVVFREKGGRDASGRENAGFCQTFVPKASFVPSAFPPLAQAPRPQLPCLPSSVMADPDLGNLVSEPISPPGSDTRTGGNTTLDCPQPSIPRAIEPTPSVSAAALPSKDPDTQTGSSAVDEDDLGPATYKSNGAYDNRKLCNHFNEERKRFWEQHFPVVNCQPQAGWESKS
jgi:hypothetical protein